MFHALPKACYCDSLEYLQVPETGINVTKVDLQLKPNTKVETWVLGTFKDLI